MGGGGGSADIGGNGYTSPDGSVGAGGAMVVLRDSGVASGGATVNFNGAQGSSVVQPTAAAVQAARWLLQPALADWQAP